MLSENIPKHWRQVMLSEVAERIGVGLAISVSEHFRKDGVKLIRNQNIKRNYFNSTDVIFVANEFAERNKSKKVQASDVVIVRTGSNIGMACVVPIEFDGALTFTTLIARTATNILDAHYLSYFINSEKGIQEVNRLMAGGGKGNLNAGELKKYCLLLPPLCQQNIIVDILFTWDKAIKLIEEFILLRIQSRKYLMQKLLTGKKRFPGYTKPWETVSLGDIFTNRTETGREDLPLLSITGEGGVVSRETLVKRDTSNPDKGRYLRISPGDIGYNTMRMWQGVSGLSSMEGIVSPAYTVVTPDKTLDAEFMATFFKYPPTVNLFRRYSQGLVNDTLNLKFRHFSEIKVTIPDKEEQRKIASVFRVLDQELTLLKQELALYKEQKKGLMQQLLTGKKRIKVTEAA